MVAAPFSMIRLPTTVEPVNEIRSTLGDSVSSSPTKWSDAVTTLTTPAGMSVFSAISRPRRVALNGVFGAGLSTTVLPVPSAWPSLLRVTSKGKFHGTIAPTTPTGSRQTLRVVNVPVRLITLSPRSVSQAYSSISLAGYFNPSSSGASSWGPKVIARGEPTSRMSSSRSSSFSSSIASCSCNRQRLRSSRLVDQSVSSKARRAASMARCMSSFDASATSPSDSSVAGLMFVKVPAWPSTSLPSIIIFGSNRTFTVSAIFVQLSLDKALVRAPGRGMRSPDGLILW